jgi:hypothetical protein
LPVRLADSFQCTFPWVEGCIDGVLEPFTVFLTSRLVSHGGGEVFFSVLRPFQVVVSRVEICSAKHIRKYGDWYLHFLDLCDCLFIHFEHRVLTICMNREA